MFNGVLPRTNLVAILDWLYTFIDYLANKPLEVITFILSISISALRGAYPIIEKRIFQLKLDLQLRPEKKDLTSDDEVVLVATGKKILSISKKTLIERPARDEPIYLFINDKLKDSLGRISKNGHVVANIGRLPVGTYSIFISDNPEGK